MIYFKDYELCTMNNYLNWQEKTIADFSDENINKLYNRGFVFTRKDKGIMNQTRSVRIDLSKFELSSENKRILRKTENLKLNIEKIPYKNYNWKIGKLAKDFYKTKFGTGIFSANKIKELLTNENKTNFNKLFVYCHSEESKNPLNSEDGSLANNQNESEMFLGDKENIGYCICFENNQIIHYSYPFYNFESDIVNLGISMMTRAVLWAKENNKKYVYLGSASNSKSLYKFQFKGIEWFDGEKWQKNIDSLKKELK